MEKEEVNLYDIFMNYSYSEIKDLFKKAKTKEEKEAHFSDGDYDIDEKQKSASLTESGIKKQKFTSMLII